MGNCDLGVAMIGNALQSACIKMNFVIELGGCAAGLSELIEKMEPTIGLEPMTCRLRKDLTCVCCCEI
jgi:hypothetical protein